MSLSEVIKTSLDQIHYIAKTETVIGEPIVAGDVTLIPVSRISVGFAAGGGGGKEEKSGNGAGTGGGVTITPVAFIAVHEGRVQVHSLTPSDPFINQILAMAPDAVRQISRFFGKKKETDGAEEK